MRFRRFRHAKAGAYPTPPPPPAEPREWADSGLADEVEAYLAGRYVDHLTAQGHPVPVWSVLNRLAHADHATLVRVVEGNPGDTTHKPHPWGVPERFIAARLVATRGATPEGLDAVQQAVLVPLELSLIERARYDKLTPDVILEMGVRALDAHPAGA
jgi:hypothetical protein